MTKVIEIAGARLGWHRAGTCRVSLDLPRCQERQLGSVDHVFRSKVGFCFRENGWFPGPCFIFLGFMVIYGWWFQTWLNFFPSYMRISSSQLTNSIIFQRGWNKPPTRWWFMTLIGATVISTCLGKASHFFGSGRWCSSLSLEDWW